VCLHNLQDSRATSHRCADMLPLPPLALHPGKTGGQDAGLLPVDERQGVPPVASLRAGRRLGRGRLPGGQGPAGHGGRPGGQLRRHREAPDAGRRRGRRHAGRQRRRGIRGGPARRGDGAGLGTGGLQAGLGVLGRQGGLHAAHQGHLGGGGLGRQLLLGAGRHVREDAQDGVADLVRLKHDESETSRDGSIGKETGLTWRQIK
jgi:hypothetical protein